MALTTLVVSERSATADHLSALLNGDGMPTRRATPDWVLTRWTLADGVPDLLLVAAALDIDVVRQVSQRIVQTAKQSPTVVTFADSHFADLEPHVLAGLDYIVPPFIPSLVRSRLSACYSRQELTRTTEEMRTSAGVAKYEQELQIGREIQAGFLPERLPVRAGWQLTARFQPAREVAGDFYDAFELLGGKRVGLVVADVCDKGVGAALFMALIRSLLRHTAIHMHEYMADYVEDADREPGSDAALLLRAVVATNQYLTANHLQQGYFATLFFGVLDPRLGSLIYINCGHNPPVLRHADGTYSLLRPTGPALGLVPDSVFGLSRARLNPGDLLFVYTDGVPEARNTDGHFFTEDRMLRILAEQPAEADALLDRIEREISAHVGPAEQFDDITMVALSRQIEVPKQTWRLE